MGNGASTIKTAADMARLKTENEQLRNEINDLKGGGKKTHAIVVKDSGAEKKFARPAADNRRVEVSAEVLSKGSTSYEKKTIDKPADAVEMISAVAKTSILFTDLSDKEKQDCVDAFYMVTAKASETVIQQGDVGHNFYVIKEGTLKVEVELKRGGAVVKYADLVAGGSFGELALLYNTPRAATVTADTDVVLYALDRESYRAITKHHKGVNADDTVDFLKQVPSLKSLKPREFNRLAEAMEEEEHDTGSTIVLQGEKGDYFYIIKEGTVGVSKDGTEVSALKKGDFFGEAALLTEDTRNATCTAKSPSTLLSIDRANFIELLGTLDELNNRADEGEIKTDLTPSDVTQHKDFHDIQFSDLEIKGTLGCGAFGRVKLVKQKTTGECFALKCLTKTDIVANNLQEHIVNERNVMLELSHPFILKLHNSFKDTRYIYFLLELALGGELFTFLRKAGRFNEKASKFYAAPVILAFELMHSKSIVYRDLKPENLILDEKGYIKVVDFGLAKVVTDRTWTLCGTPDYLAPEIILSKGHDRAVDYWAAGILIYEMCAGFVPYYSDDPMEVYQLILGGDLKFPSHFSRPCMDICSKLLSQNQGKRLGNMKNGVKDIIKHKWFAGFDWAGLLERKLAPPIAPVIKAKDDMSNFDEYPDDEGDVEECLDWDPDL